MNQIKKQRTQQKFNSTFQLKSDIFGFLEKPCTTFGIVYHMIVFSLILSSLSLDVIVTIDAFATNIIVHDVIYYLEASMAVIFTVEYSLRCWSCSSQTQYMGFNGHLRFITKPFMIIDMILILATVVVYFTHDLNRLPWRFSIFQFLNVLQILRILRLDRQQGAFKIMSVVVYEHRQELMTCWYLSFILLVACSFSVYIAELSDPKVSSNKVKNLGDGMYFGMISLLAIGYGDFSPNNWVTKIMVVVFSFIGTAFFALPAGILGSGFALQVAHSQKKKHFNRRRHPAAMLIQYAWRYHSTKPSLSLASTWFKYNVIIEEMLTPICIDGSLPSLHDDHSCVGILWKSSQMLSHKSKSAKRKCSPAVDTGISSVIGIHDQSHENESFFFGYQAGENQLHATIPNHLTPVNNNNIRGKLNSEFSEEHQRLLNITTRPLNNSERHFVRFLIKLKFNVALRKFKIAQRPYDIHDVIEQYTAGQVDMFSLIRKFQSRVENALGITDENRKIATPSLANRMESFEKKIDNLNMKMDELMEMLNCGRLT